jgi:PAS domain S-box-containing protein
MTVAGWPAEAGMARWVRPVPWLAAVLVVVVGAVVLAGWALRLPLLTSVVPSLPAMMPNTAVAFLLAGLSLWMVGPQQTSRWRRRAGQGLALLVALFGMVVLGQYLTGWQLGLDRWLFSDQLAGVGMRFPGRPSPHTATAFVLVGLALALLDADRQRGFRPALLLAPLSAAAALVALLGYVYQVRYLYGVATGTGMALHTALALLVLNTGLLACRPDRQPTRTFLAAGPGGLLARRLVPALLLVPLGVGALVLLGQRGRLFEPAFGTALTTVAMLAALTAVIAVTVRDLDRAELARRVFQAELLEAEQRFRRVTNAATDAIVSADSHGRLRTWNQGAERMFGWQPEEVIGGPLTVIIPQRLHASHEHGLARVRQTGHSKLAGSVVELVGLRRDGTEFPIELSIGMWQSTEGPRFSGVIRDITSRKQAEQALEEANQAMQAAKQAAEHANHAKSEHLARMSHELRTPLNAILGFAQLLALDELTTEQRDSLGHILAGARHLLALITEVLDIAAIEAGRLHLSLEPVAIAEVIDEAVSLIRPLADQHGILLVPPAHPCTEQVLADRRRLKQILLNLLSNAVKYNHPGGSVHLAYTQPSSERFRVEVADTGPGIPPDEIERLFVPFERLGGDPTSVEGTGLGLALSQRLAEAMDGSLFVASTVGQGSTFWVELPQTPAPADHGHHLRPSPQQDQATGVTSRPAVP